jgi:hypothetical protein
MKMGRRVGALAIGVLVGAACVVLAIFLYREGLVRAGAWAGIIGLFGIPIGALGVWLAWPRGDDKATEHQERPNVRFQRNITSGHGTIFAVQDGNQSVNYHGTADRVDNVPPETQKGDEK